MTMTFNEYDKLVDLFNEIDTPTIWPTPKQIEKFEENPDKWITFMIYLEEKGKDPENKTEEYSKKNVSAFLRKHLELVD